MTTNHTLLPQNFNRDMASVAELRRLNDSQRENYFESLTPFESAYARELFANATNTVGSTQ